MIVRVGLEAGQAAVRKIGGKVAGKALSKEKAPMPGEKAAETPATTREPRPKTTVHAERHMPSVPGCMGVKSIFRLRNVRLIAGADDLGLRHGFHKPRTRPVNM